MRKLSRIIIFPLALSAIILVGCAGTASAQGSKSDVEAEQKSFANILVLAIADNYTNRAQFERTVVSNLKAQGVSATAYYAAVGGNKPIDRDAVRAVATSGVFDAVLVTRVLAQDADVERKGGSAAAKVTRRDGSPIDFFRYDYEELDEPGTFEIHNSATLQSELYRVTDEKQVWSLEISNKGADNVGKIIDEVAAKVVKNLRRDRWIAR